MLFNAIAVRARNAAGSSTACGSWPRRTRNCRPNSCPAPARPACSTSGSGWPGRSTTPSPRALTAILTQLEAPTTCAGRPAAWRLDRTHPGQGEPERGPPIGAGAPPGALEEAHARRRSVAAREGSRASGVSGRVGHRRAGPLHPEVGEHAAAGGPGGPDQRRQARIAPARPDAVVHGGCGGLDIRDDGDGFTPGASTGFGLVAMRQRVTRLAGAFELETAPGQGTGISATVPAIPADPEDDGDSADHRGRPPHGPRRTARNLRRGRRLRGGRRGG